MLGDRFCNAPWIITRPGGCSIDETAVSELCQGWWVYRRDRIAVVIWMEEGKPALLVGMQARAGTSTGIGSVAGSVTWVRSLEYGPFMQRGCMKGA